MIYPVKCSVRDKGDFLGDDWPFFTMIGRSKIEKFWNSVFLKEEVLNIISYVHLILFTSMLLKKT